MHNGKKRNQNKMELNRYMEEKAIVETEYKPDSLFCLFHNIVIFCNLSWTSAWCKRHPSFFFKNGYILWKRIQENLLFNCQSCIALNLIPLVYKTALCDLFFLNPASCFFSL